MRPLVLLDVDGVINDLNRWSERPWTYTDYEAMFYIIRVPDYMPEAIAQIHTHADVVWCTTWEDKANEHISPMVGLPQDLPFVELSRAANYTTVAKRAGAMNFARPYIDAGVPVLWIEDFDYLIHDPITYVDTTPDLVLMPDVIETEVLRRIY